LTALAGIEPVIAKVTVNRKKIQQVKTLNIFVAKYLKEIVMMGRRNLTGSL
jgi:hypothetical protein